MYLSAGVTKVVVAASGVAVAAGLREVGGGIRAFSSTVTYGPFSRDYIQFPDLARKRRLRSPNAAWSPIGATRFVPSETEGRAYLADLFFREDFISGLIKLAI